MSGDARDAARWRFIDRHWSNCKVKIDRDNNVSRMTVTIDITKRCSGGPLLAKMLDDCIAEQEARKP